MGQERSDYFLKMVEISRKRKPAGKAQVRFTKELRADFQTLRAGFCLDPDPAL